MRQWGWVQGSERQRGEPASKGGDLETKGEDDAEKLGKRQTKGGPGGVQVAVRSLDRVLGTGDQIWALESSHSHCGHRPGWLGAWHRGADKGCQDSGPSQAVMGSGQKWELIKGGDSLPREVW